MIRQLWRHLFTLLFRWLLRSPSQEHASAHSEDECNHDKTAPPDSPAERGISVVIPERGNPSLLWQCLQSLQKALHNLSEPYEILVVASGSDPEHYRMMQLPSCPIHWIFFRRPLCFGKAVEKGLESARYPWVYLVNSDMQLEPQAISELLPWRSPGVFSLASQIFFMDGSRRREETGWTGFAVRDTGLDLFDLPPQAESWVRGNLYGGGGASLFQKRILLPLIRKTHDYRPFYWEDVEWGVRAWRLGYFSLFCPASKVWHHHRATNLLFYPGKEIDRIFRRNSSLFQLRNPIPDLAPERILSTLGSLPLRSKLELLRPGLLWGIYESRRRPVRFPLDETVLRWSGSHFFMHPFDSRQEKPIIILVTPYAVLPPSHGGAVRIVNLCKHLQEYFRILLLSDEWTLYDAESGKYYDLFSSIHLVGGRIERLHPPPGRRDRIETHSHHQLRQQLSLLQRAFSPKIIQIEFVELLQLIEAKRGSAAWCITLHDVNWKETTEPLSTEDAFEAEILQRYRAVMVCSEEDALLLRHRKSTVIPNGVCGDKKESYQTSRSSRALLFMGVFRYQPNYEGILEFLIQVYPALLQKVPHLELWILGGKEAPRISAQHGSFQQPGVKVWDYVEHPDDFFTRCALTINPLLGIRGSSLKLIESLSAGRICVSTKEGARGFLRKQYTSLITVPTIADFYAPILRLLQDEDYRCSMERLTDREISEMIWEKSAEIQIGLYRRLLNSL